MLVKKLTLENFKSTANRIVNLDPECTLITGNNRIGKTTIGEAVPFALYGVTLDGSPRCDPLIMQGTKKAVVAVTVQIDGTAHTIKRTKTRKGTEVILDGIDAAQTDIDNLIGFIGKEFIAMYNPLQILKMEPSKARAFFMSLLETPSIEGVLKELLPEHQEMLKLVTYIQNPDLALEQHRKELKTAEEEAIALSGAIDEVKNQISVIKNELLSCTKPDEQEKIESFQIPAEPQQPDGSELKILQNKVSAAREEYKSLTEQKRRLLQQYPPKPGSKCPACSQDIPAGMMAGVLRKWERQAEKVNQLVSEVDQKMSIAAGKGKKLAEQLEIEQKTFSLKTTLYKAALERWKSSTEASRNTFKAYTEGLRRLQEKQTNYNNLVNRKEGLEKRLIEIEKESEDYQRVIERLKQEIEAIKEYRFKSVELQMKQIKPHLKKVDISLFDVVKSTGEIKPTFVLTYEGRPVSMFSRSEEILAGLEIALLVQKLRCVNMPVFIDNTESAPGIELPEGPQYLLVKVVFGQELRVEPAAKDKREVA